MNSTLALISGLGLETSGLGLEALGFEAFGLGLETLGLVNISGWWAWDLSILSQKIAKIFAGRRYIVREILG